MSEEHIITKLHRLRRDVDNAIDSIRNGECRPCTPSEAAEHAARYGEGAWTLGEFVITERNPSQEGPAPLHNASAINPDPQNHMDPS